MKFNRHLVTVTILITIMAVQSVTFLGSASADPIVTNYPTPSNNYVQEIAPGSDGALWFTEDSAGKIGRIDTSGNETDYDLPLYNSEPHGITQGPDGGVWFTQTNVPYMSIGRIDTSGNVTEFTDKNDSSRAFDITTGSDGALWFTEAGSPYIGRLTTSGTFTQFPLPDGTIGITSGPDGALWFTDYSDGAIGKITTSGVVTEFNIPTANSYPYGITSGPDGALWFTETGTNQIGKITTSGTFTEYPVSTVPQFITSGPDGALWFPEPITDKIGRITTDGSVTEYADAATATRPQPLSITTGSDGALWFTDSQSIGRITTPTMKPTITSIASKTVNARDPLNFTVTTTGTPTPSITETGGLPNGITFTDNGDGTATFAGQASTTNKGYYFITLTATNGAGSTAQNFQLTTTNYAEVPTFLNGNSVTEGSGVPFSYTIDTTGVPIPNITKVGGSGKLPAGVTFKDNNDGTATLSGAVASKNAGQYSFGLQAKNKSGVAEQTFTLNITN